MLLTPRAYDTGQVRRISSALCSHLQNEEPATHLSIGVPCASSIRCSARRKLSVSAVASKRAWHGRARRPAMAAAVATQEHPAEAQSACSSGFSYLAIGAPVLLAKISSCPTRNGDATTLHCVRGSTQRFM